MYGLPITELFAVTLFLGLLGLAVLTDLNELRIPNRVCLLIALLYPAYVLACPEPVNWLAAIGVAVGVFAFGLVLFCTGAMGGGDVKLMTVTALWAGPSSVISFLVFTTFTGGALALLMISAFRFPLASMLETIGATDLRDMLMGRVIPYGIAIAAGAYVSIAPMLLEP